MKRLPELFERNRAWAARIEREHPGFFQTLSRQQAPKYLWIGCSDSRVPANQIVDLLPGEVFVHRNVANVVTGADLNCQSVLQFAVDVLKVEHVIVVGHYGCGGVRAAMEGQKLGLVDRWLVHVNEVIERRRKALDAIGDPVERYDRLCEWNVLDQALNVCRSRVLEVAWERGQNVTVHGWIYGLKDGLIRDLGFCVNRPDEVPAELWQEETGEGG